MAVAMRQYTLHFWFSAIYGWNWAPHIGLACGVTCPACGICMLPTQWRSHVQSDSHPLKLEKRMRLHMAGLVGMPAHEWAKQDSYSVAKRCKLGPTFRGSRRREKALEEPLATKLPTVSPLDAAPPMEEEVAPPHRPWMCTDPCACCYYTLSTSLDGRSNPGWRLIGGHWSWWHKGYPHANFKNQLSNKGAPHAPKP